MLSDSVNNEENLPNLPLQSAPLELTTKHNLPMASMSDTYGFTPPLRTPKSSKMNENEIAKYTYPIQMTNPFERDNWTVATDHCYAKPYNWRPEATFLRPTKTLFIPKNIPAKQNLFNPRGFGKEKVDIIDVEIETEASTPVYDVEKAKILMEECDKYSSLAKSDDKDDDWEEKIVKINWSPSQHRLFNGFINIVNSLQMAKLAQTGLTNEPILRRTIIDKAVLRVRRLFASFSFDTKLAQWLHNLCIDNFDFQYLSIYLDILQTLKAKLPSFVEKMLYSPNSALRVGPLNNENLMPLLKQPWDPVATSLNQDKPKKLPGNPIIVLVPSSPVMSKRNHKWVNLLSNLGTVVTAPTNFGSAGHRMTMTNCLDQMFSLTRGKVQEVRENFHGRQIILAGYGAGATLALQIAQVESVLCVIALGFSLLTAEGRRGEPDDILLELQCPVLFVIGQCSSTSLQEDMEDLRERMRVETGLIVVGSADNNLKISKKKKQEEGVTQSIVDRCIIDEVGEFISCLILSPFPPQIRQSPPTLPTGGETSGLRKKAERKRFNSNTSSLDSEPPSPTPPRISRPVGRPPGKAKSKLEAKWAAQIAQGIPPLAPITTSTVTNLPPKSPPPDSPTTPTEPLSPSNNHSTASNNSNSDTSTATESPVPYMNHSPPTSVTPERVTKKIKTLKPVTSSTTGESSTNDGMGESRQSSPARLQAYNLNRNVMVGGQLSTLLQGGIKTIPPSAPKPTSAGIKVLGNVQLNKPTTKLSAAKTIDLSKLTVMNKTSTGNVVLLPDGKIKALGATMKGTGGTPILLPISPSKSSERGTGRGKYVTSKRQIISPRSSRPSKRPAYTNITPLHTNLPPPTNLTTQDIMDLPIIFADDNQILDSSTSVPTDLSTSSHSTPKTIQSLPKLVTSTPTPTNKFLIVSKPSNMTANNFIITSTGVKRPLNMVSNISKPPAKYTKIILSKKPSDFNLQIKKSSSSTVTNIEAVDLETELKATTITKPSISLPELKNIQMVMPKKEENISYELLQVVKDEISKQDFDDPDYVPPKNLKLS